MEKRDSIGGRIAVTLSPKGIDAVSFLSGDRLESLKFYMLVEPEIQALEDRILAIVGHGSGEGALNERKN